MRPPVGISSSSFVMTPSGPVKADGVQRGDELVGFSKGKLLYVPVRRVDRGLCCTMVEVLTADGARAVMGSGTDLLDEGGAGETVSLLSGGLVTHSRIISITRLNFCQHAIHFYCGEGSHIFAGANSGPFFAVNASFMERDDNGQ